MGRSISIIKRNIVKRNIVKRNDEALLHRPLRHRLLRRRRERPSSFASVAVILLTISLALRSATAAPPSPSATTRSSCRSWMQAARTSAHACSTQLGQRATQAAQRTTSWARSTIGQLHGQLHDRWNAASASISSSLASLEQQLSGISTRANAALSTSPKAGLAALALLSAMAVAQPALAAVDQPAEPTVAAAAQPATPVGGLHTNKCNMGDVTGKDGVRHIMIVGADKPCVKDDPLFRRLVNASSTPGASSAPTPPPPPKPSATQPLPTQPPFLTQRHFVDCFNVLWAANHAAATHSEAGAPAAKPPGKVKPSIVNGASPIDTRQLSDSNPNSAMQSWDELSCRAQWKAAHDAHQITPVPAPANGHQWAEWLDKNGVLHIVARGTAPPETRVGGASGTRYTRSARGFIDFLTRWGYLVSPAADSASQEPTAGEGNVWMEFAGSDPQTGSDEARPKVVFLPAGKPLGEAIRIAFSQGIRDQCPTGTEQPPEAEAFHYVGDDSKLGQDPVSTIPGTRIPAAVSNDQLPPSWRLVVHALCNGVKNSVKNGVKTVASKLVVATLHMSGPIRSKVTLRPDGTPMIQPAPIPNLKAILQHLAGRLAPGQARIERVTLAD